MNYATPSRPAIISAAGLWLCALVLSLSAGAAPFFDSLPTMDTLRSRLELTSQQEEQLRPLFDKRASELRQTKDLLQQASSRQQKRDVLREAKRAGNTFNSQVESILTPTQRHEWREIRSELVEKAKERAEEKSESG